MNSNCLHNISSMRLKQSQKGLHRIFSLILLVLLLFCFSLLLYSCLLLLFFLLPDNPLEKLHRAHIKSIVNLISLNIPFNFYVHFAIHYHTRFYTISRSLLCFSFPHSHRGSEDPPEWKEKGMRGHRIDILYSERDK